MDYYGNNDWRDYLAHYGTPRHSGRFPWGSGKNPRQGTVGYYQGKGKALGPGSSGARYGSSSSVNKARVYRDWDEWEKENSKEGELYYYDEKTDSYVKKPKNVNAEQTDSSKPKNFKDWVKDRINLYKKVINGEPSSGRTPEDIRKIIESDGSDMSAKSDEEQTLLESFNQNPDGKKARELIERGVNVGYDFGNYGEDDSSKMSPKELKRFVKDVRRNADTYDSVTYYDEEKDEIVRTQFDPKLTASPNQKRLKADQRVKDAYEALSDARKEYDERMSQSLEHQFYALPFKEREPFIKKAVDYCFKKYGDGDEPTRQEIWDWYVHGDGDQGDHDSFHYYCESKGTTVDKENVKDVAAAKAFNKAAENYTRSLLGEYADAPLRMFSSEIDDTVTKAVTNAIINLRRDDIDNKYTSRYTSNPSYQPSSSNKDSKSSDIVPVNNSRVISLAAQGKTQAEIAELLGVSTATVNKILNY